jgi:hypothetical protein
MRRESGPMSRLNDMSGVFCFCRQLMEGAVRPFSLALVVSVPVLSPATVATWHAFEVPWECESLSTMTETLLDIAPQGIKASTGEGRQVKRLLLQDRFFGFSSPS